MDRGYVAIIDSGIGGLSVLSELKKRLPNESFIYFGDNKNAPYGCRKERDLLCLTMRSLQELKKYPLKCVVLGCNTLSTTIMRELCYYNPEIKFFGTYPPVEINKIRNRKVLLLCTKNTAKNYKTSDNLCVLPMCNLAIDIERNIFDLSKVDFYKHVMESFEDYYGSSLSNDVLTTKGTQMTTKNLKMIFDHRLRYFEVVILGCTHYFFIKNKIFDHFRPHIILGGESFTANKVKLYLQNKEMLEKDRKNQMIFVGDSAELNKRVFKANFPMIYNN